MSSVYFAHSMLDYRSEAARSARREVARLRPHGAVLDPEWLDWNRMANDLAGAPIIRPAPKPDPAPVYDFVAALCDCCFVLEHQGHVGRGVHDEVSRFLALGKPVYALRRNEGVWARTLVEGVEIVDKDDWKVRYARLRTSANVDR